MDGTRTRRSGVAFAGILPGIVVVSVRTVTHDIIQADIDQATALIRAGGMDEEVVALLVRRGVEPGLAERVLNDLRAGRPVKPTIVAPMASIPRPAPEPGPARRRRHGPHRPPSRSNLVWTVVVLAVFGLIVGLMALKSSRARASREASAGSSGPASRDEVVDVVVEIQPDGLRLAGRLVTAADAFGTITGILGSPTRTNAYRKTEGALPGSAIQGDQTRAGQSAAEATAGRIYVFDRQGLLLYVNPDGRGASLVVDFDGLDGESGAGDPFEGTLRVGGDLLPPGTSSRVLRSEQRFGVTNSAPESGILAGRVGQTTFLCAYLKSQERLSLVQINLR